MQALSFGRAPDGHSEHVGSPVVRYHHPGQRRKRHLYTVTGSLPAAATGTLTDTANATCRGKPPARDPELDDEQHRHRDGLHRHA